MNDDTIQCRVFGREDVSNDAHRRVLDALVTGFTTPDTTLLCEPSLHNSSTRPPDLVIVAPYAGVHVIEVKGYSLPGIEALMPGGEFHIRIAGRLRNKNPIAQVRNAMFDIKNTTERFVSGDLIIPFKYWVAFPNISRSDWVSRWGKDAFCPPEFLFQEDMHGLASQLRKAGEKRLANAGLKQWPCDQMNAVWKAFGDSGVLYPPPDDRPPRPVNEDTLGEQFDEAARTYKSLSDEQQKLSSQNWNEGPRLVRGVAGSGKTIVLANNLARRLQRQQSNSPLFEDQPIRILAVCNNRSLVPFLKKKIDSAYRQRTGQQVPPGAVDIFYYNGLMYHLSRKGLWRYQRINEDRHNAAHAPSDEERTKQYLQELEETKRDHPEMFEAVVYDAIYIDEGQDFDESDFRLLKALCRVEAGREANMYIFYDDAQNFLGRKRPNWSSIGLNVRGGRAVIMSQCFRNTRPIVEAAFNVLYGTCASGDRSVPTREFGDIATLQEKQLIADHSGFWKVHFAVRNGLCNPKLTLASSKGDEIEKVVGRLKWMVEEESVRPQDILVLGYTRDRVEEIAEAIKRKPIKGVDHIHVAFHEQDKLLGQRSTLTLSTTASAKGYDAYCVLLVSGNEFPANASGRISFYIGCTRAIEYLEVFAHRNERLVVELQEALAKQDDQ